MSKAVANIAIKLGRLLTRLVGNPVRKTPQQNAHQLLLLACQLHGSHYYDCLTLLENQQLFVGEKLVLHREPTNEYDSYAIEVLSKNGIKLGYIPKKHNQVIATLMDQQCYVTAYIDEIMTTEWEPVSIQVFLHV